MTTMAVARSNWRDAEAAVFETAAAMFQGQLPGTAPRDAAEARRLGYLAEAVAAYLEAADTAALLRFAAEMRRRAEALAGPVDEADCVALIPGSRPGSQPRGMDELGDHWRIAPGLDVGRFTAEGYGAQT